MSAVRFEVDFGVDFGVAVALPPAKGIVEPEDSDAGGSFTVGETLTIYEAAMVYSGRRPDNPFFEGASLRQLEVVLGRGVSLRRNFDEMPYKISWSVCCELCERVSRGEIKPVRKFLLSNGLEVDPRLTIIRTVDLASLAEKRGDASDAIFDFSSRMSGSTLDAPPPRTKQTRQQPKMGPAKERILARVADTIGQTCRYPRLCADATPRSRNAGPMRAPGRPSSRRIAARRPKNLGHYCRH